MPADPPPPWWVLPNAAALDAPVVAVVWQRFLADRVGVGVPWAATVALAAVVWAVYLADRLFDARRGDCGADRGADRHRAAARFPKLFACGAILAATVAAVAAVVLPDAYLICGMWVGLGVVAYLAAVHLVAGGLRRAPGAKELMVGVGFAAGVAVPLMADGPSVGEWVPAVVAFAAVCWLNCRLIDRWESAASGSAWTDVLLAAVILVVATALPTAVGLAVGTAVVALLIVHVAFGSAPRVARVLADAALLTPLAAWGLP